MPFTRPDTFWATVRIRIEETGPGAHRSSVLRSRGFDGEVQVERGWTNDGPAIVHVRLGSYEQLDPKDSLLVVQQTRPMQFPYVEALEAEHVDDRIITLIAWPYLQPGPGEIPGAPVAPPCAFEADLLVLRVNG